MYTSNFWNKFNLRGKKISLLTFFLTLVILQNTFGQVAKEVNLPDYDQKWLHYGFLIGVQFSGYRLSYNNEFLSPQMDTVHSIEPYASPGFSLGFIINLRINDYMDLRLLPQVGFYEYKVKYYSRTGHDRTGLVEATTVEFPLLLKYKSERRGNQRMYIIGGIKPSIDASGKKKEERLETIRAENRNLSLEAGLGLDIYYPLFKFSPELRFSYGIMNMLKPDINDYSRGVDRLSTYTFSLYLLFE